MRFLEMIDSPKRLQPIRVLIYLVFHLWINFQIISAKCPNNCNGNGDCNIYSRCTCYDGFMGADCSLRICPFGAAWSDEAIATDVAHQSAECSNRGICDRSKGNCECMDGFTGSACERLTCQDRCNAKGICYSMHDFAGKTRNSESVQYDYSLVWDAAMIQGCDCDYPNTGYDCRLRECPRGDDPLTTGQVNEVQLVECRSSTGSFVLFYNGQPSRWIPATANPLTVKRALLQGIPELKDVKVTFSLPLGHACQLQTNIIIIEFTTNFGPQNPLVPQGDQTLIASGGSILVNADGVSTWTDFNQHQLQSVKGSKENDICANRGACDLNEGTCNCYSTNGDEYASSNGYGVAGSRGDCGYVFSSTSPDGISTCPGVPQCSGHGVCDTSSYRCYCSSGWGGGDCSERVCPNGTAWFSYPSDNNVAHFDFAECSNMGICDKTLGKCACRDGFYGEACEYMACGGGVTNACSGHGTCMSMAQLALWSLANGAPTDFTYGSDPNNPSTWDADKIHGCLCDEGFSGYDCSLRDCVTGDDPGTYDDHVEVQLLQCIATTGNFSLSFRTGQTAILPASITASQLKHALEQLTAIQHISVYFAYDGPPPNGTFAIIPPKKTAPDGTPLWYNPDTYPTGLFTYDVTSHTTNYQVNSTFCHADGTQIAIIVFTHTHGDLPPIAPDTEYLVDTVHTAGGLGTGVINVFTDGQVIHGLTSIQGTTENDVCNNRGLCNYETGQCQCFETWTSSDGSRQGPAGDTGDCGYRNDLLYSSFNSISPPFVQNVPLFDHPQQIPA